LLGRSIAVDTIPEPAHMITAMAATLGGIVVGTLLMPDSPDQRQEVRRFLDGVEAGPLVSESIAGTSTLQWSPARIVGISIGALGALLIIVMLLMVPAGRSALSLGVGGTMLAVGSVLVALPRLRIRRRSANE
jgi:hypothetical protein